MNQKLTSVGDVAFEVYWSLLVSGADEGLRRTALHVAVVAGLEGWGGWMRVGHRRWLFPLCDSRFVACNGSA